VLWFATSMITEMHDMVFQDVRSGVWPRVYVRTIPDVLPLTSPDFDNELTERARWLMNTPDAALNEADVGWRPRIYYYDYLRSKTISGSGTGSRNGDRAIRTLDSAGDCRGVLAGGWGITAIDLSPAYPAGVFLKVDTTPDGSLPRDIHNMFLYIVRATVPALIGRKAQITSAEIDVGSIRNVFPTFAAALQTLVDDGLVVGDRFILSPVYFRVVAPNVGIVDPETGQVFGKSFNRARLINSVGAAFTDVSGEPSTDGLVDNFLQGLVYEGTLVDPTARRAVVDVEGNLVGSVVDGEGADYAGFGSTDSDTEGRYGIKGNSLSPGLEIMCPDLDFRLLEMVARGKILGVERSRMTRST